MHLSNRGDASADRNRHWNPGVCKTTAEMGDCPPFQLRIPLRSPMRSKSQSLYTSPASHRVRKIPRLEGGVRKTPLRRPTNRGICRFPATRALILRWPCPRPTAGHRWRPPLRDRRITPRRAGPRSTSPLLMIRPGERTGVAAKGEFRRIMVPLDGSDLEEQAPGHASDIGKAMIQRISP